VILGRGDCLKVGLSRIVGVVGGGTLNPPGENKMPSAE